METHLTDLDAAFLFKGAPDDQCQAPHMGYVLKGKYGMRIAEGVEVFEAGDAFFIGPGHTPIIFAGCEVVYFTRTEEANRELPVVMANLMKWSPGNFVDISIMLLLVSNCQIGARNPLGLSCRADVASGRDCNIARCSRTRRS